MFYNFRKNKKAFTLVELIVVIAIIAILGAVVGVTVSTFVNRARKSAATTPLSEFASKWSLKEDNMTLKNYIKELYPDDYTNFYIPTNNKDQLDKTKPNASFYLYYHDTNCGDYWGYLDIKSGSISAKTTVTTTDKDPGSLTAVS